MRGERRGREGGAERAYCDGAKGKQKHRRHKLEKRWDGSDGLGMDADANGSDEGRQGRREVVVEGGGGSREASMRPDGSQLGLVEEDRRRRGEEEDTMKR